MINIAANLVILELGSSPSRTPYPQGSMGYTSVGYAIKTVLDILGNSPGRDLLTELALKYDKAWGVNSRWNEDRRVAGEYIDLELLSTCFPTVVVDRYLTNIDMLGATSKVPWDGLLEQFNPRQSCTIYLNGTVRFFWSYI